MIEMKKRLVRDVRGFTTPSEMTRKEEGEDDRLSTEEDPIEENEGSGIGQSKELLIICSCFVFMRIPTERIQLVMRI